MKKSHRCSKTSWARPSCVPTYAFRCRANSKTLCLVNFQILQTRTQNAVTISTARGHQVWSAFLKITLLMEVKVLWRRPCRPHLLLQKMMTLIALISAAAVAWQRASTSIKSTCLIPTHKAWSSTRLAKSISTARSRSRNYRKYLKHLERILSLSAVFRSARWAASMNPQFCISRSKQSYLWKWKDKIQKAPSGATLQDSEGRRHIVAPNQSLSRMNSVLKLQTS